MRLLLAIALTLLGVPSVAQTPRNVTLLGSFNPAESSSGCWGYRDPATGTELAFLLANTGTYFMDCTTGVPVQRAYIPGPVSGWREARTYGRHAYIVTEGGGGMQIVDLVNPLGAGAGRHAHACPAGTTRTRSSSTRRGATSTATAPRRACWCSTSLPIRRRRHCSRRSRVSTCTTATCRTVTRT
jgi:hypothetical protein